MQDDGEIESDLGDDNSTASSCFGEPVEDFVHPDIDDPSGPAGDIAEWSNIDDDTRDERINDTLKHFGNVGKRAMSKLILKDLLGKEAMASIKGMKKKRGQSLRRDKRKFEVIDASLTHFDEKMSKRRKKLHECIVHSKEKSYVLQKKWWIDEYNKVMNENRNHA